MPTFVMVMRWTLVVRGIVMVWVVDLWRCSHMRMLMVVLVVERLLESLFLSVEQVTDLMNQMLIGSDVQIDQRFQNFLAVIVFGHLERDERVDVNDAQIKTVGGN